HDAQVPSAPEPPPRFATARRTTSPPPAPLGYPDVPTERRQHVTGRHPPRPAPPRRRQPFWGRAVGQREGTPVVGGGGHGRGPGESPSRPARRWRLRRC